jgi:hypothetical protein
MFDPAPIILFVYNRPEHTQRTIKALQENQFAAASELYIYSDAAKDADAAGSVNQVRSYLQTISGFKNVTIRQRHINLGVDENVILGVTEVMNEKGRAIVLEDDLLTSPYFLRYMNEALDFYEHEEQVISVHGYTYPVKEKLKESFFLKGADCWGWATWKRGWDLLELDGQKLLDQFKDDQIRKEFNFENHYPYITALEQQAEGKTSHWDIRWYASAFLLGKLTLYPGQSLVKNIGHDATGTHCGVSNVYDVDLTPSPVNVSTAIVPDPEAYLAFAGFLKNMAAAAPRKQKRLNWLSRLFR